MNLALRFFVFMGALGNDSGTAKENCDSFRVSSRHATKDILADFCRVRTSCGFHAAVLVGGGCDVSDSRALLVDCVPVGLVLGKNRRNKGESWLILLGPRIVKVIHKV